MKIEDMRAEDGHPLWEGHRKRLRNRLEREGWDALKPHERVELVLCYALPRQDVSDVARLLVDRFGSVGGVFAATRDRLMAVPGMTGDMAEWIAITGRLIRAYRNMQGCEGIRLGCYRDVSSFLKPRLDQVEGEGLQVIYADFGFNLISVSDLRESPVWWEAENTTRMVMDAIGYGARYIYLVLWKERPSVGLDRVEEARLEGIAAAICAADMDLVDCLLVNKEEIFSLRTHGRMDRLRAHVNSARLHERYGEE